MIIQQREFVRRAFAVYMMVMVGVGVGVFGLYFWFHLTFLPIINLSPRAGDTIGALLIVTAAFLLSGFAAALTFKRNLDG